MQTDIKDIYPFNAPMLFYRRCGLISSFAAHESSSTASTASSPASPAPPFSHDQLLSHHTILISLTAGLGTTACRILNPDPNLTPTQRSLDTIVLLQSFYASYYASDWAGTLNDVRPLSSMWHLIAVLPVIVLIPLIAQIVTMSSMLQR